MRVVVLLGCFFLVLGGVASVGRPSPPLPGLLTQHGTHQFAVRPAFVIFTGDASVVIGGFDGTGSRTSFGHIRWTSWTTQQAVGSGAAWDKCVDYGGCAKPYALSGRAVVPVHASDPVSGHFTRVKVGKSCWRLHRLSETNGSLSLFTYFNVACPAG
jgi:hypothetical protein